jgi:hypothetical protein
MADDITQGLYDQMAGSSDLVALLGTYLGNPCIFTGDVVPADAPRPYLWMPVPSIDLARDTKDLSGREIFRDIWCVIEDTGSADLVNTIGTLVRDLFHRVSINIGSGRTNWLTEASGPSAAPVGAMDGVAARIVSVRLAYYD